VSLAIKRLFTFQYSNARTHQTVNGNTTIIPWTPDWKNDRIDHRQLSQRRVLKDKYVRLPEGAREDFLRVVSQGFASVTENVGVYRDRADVQVHADHLGHSPMRHQTSRTTTTRLSAGSVAGD
jgi:hypothetical protein